MGETTMYMNMANEPQLGSGQCLASFRASVWLVFTETKDGFPLRAICTHRSDAELVAAQKHPGGRKYRRSIIVPGLLGGPEILVFGLSPDICDDTPKHTDEEIQDQLRKLARRKAVWG